MKEKKEEQICEVCGKPYEYQLQVNYEGGKKTCKHDSEVEKSKTELKRHANVEASAEALRMANIARKENPVEEENVVSSQSGSRGKIEKIPTKVIESIKTKVTPLLEE